jgi:hypothetical protein
MHCDAAINGVVRTVKIIHDLLYNMALCMSVKYRFVNSRMFVDITLHLSHLADALIQKSHHFLSKHSSCPRFLFYHLILLVKFEGEAAIALNSLPPGTDVSSTSSFDLHLVEVSTNVHST